MATYGGQNVGAGKTERLGKGIKAAGIIGIIYSIVAFVLLYFFASIANVENPIPCMQNLITMTNVSGI